MPAPASRSPPSPKIQVAVTSRSPGRASPGKDYRLESSSDLGLGNWIDLGVVIPSGGDTTTFTDSSPGPGDARVYYRASIAMP